jgi:hypothetical protein
MAPRRSPRLPQRALPDERLNFGSDREAEPDPAFRPVPSDCAVCAGRLRPG